MYSAECYTQQNEDVIESDEDPVKWVNGTQIKQKKKFFLTYF